MKVLPKILLALTGVAALSLAYPASVRAVPTTYVYTGNPFTTVGAPYTNSDFVTAMVTLASPLGPNMPLTQVTPLTFSLSDGQQTITILKATFSTFAFATAPTGLVTRWAVRVRLGAGASISTINDPPATPFDEGFGGGGEFGIVFQN